MCWKTDTRLCDLAPDARLVLLRAGKVVLAADVRELVNAGRMSPALTLDVVEMAFDAQIADVEVLTG